MFDSETVHLFILSFISGLITSTLIVLVYRSFDRKLIDHISEDEMYQGNNDIWRIEAKHEFRRIKMDMQSLNAEVSLLRAQLNKINHQHSESIIEVVTQESTPQIGAKKH